MTVRYNRKRTFRVWELNGSWYATETKNIVGGKLTIPYKDCIHAGSKNEIVDLIEAHCRFDELLDNGMDRTEAARIALFGE